MVVWCFFCFWRSDWRQMWVMFKQKLFPKWDLSRAQPSTLIFNVWNQMQSALAFVCLKMSRNKRSSFARHIVRSKKKHRTLLWNKQRSRKIKLTRKTVLQSWNTNRKKSRRLHFNSNNSNACGKLFHYVKARNAIEATRNTHTHLHRAEDGALVINMYQSVLRYHRKYYVMQVGNYANYVLLSVEHGIFRSLLSEMSLWNLETYSNWLTWINVFNKFDCR